MDEAAANDVDSSISEAHFIFELWSDPRSYAGLVYVRKSDGYMSFQPADSEGMMGLDDWYDLWLSDDVIIGGDGLTAPSAESITLVNNADADSWVTLNQDGSFTMQVNLYVGYGTLSGTYEETGSGYKFHVKERSFSGYDGDDVDEFEMVAIGDGMLEYTAHY